MPKDTRKIFFAHHLFMRERKKRKEKRRQKNASFFLSFFFKNKGEGEPPSEKKKTRKKHRGSRVVFRRTDASERCIQSAKKEGKMRRVLGCGEILALELYASRLSLFGANKKFWTFELPWPCFLSSSISFFLKKRTHSSDGWMQKKSRQNERKSLLSLRVFSPQKKSLNLSHHHHHHHHHLLSIHTSLYRTERRLNHFSGGREDASKKRSAVSESVTHRDGEF